MNHAPGRPFELRVRRYHQLADGRWMRTDTWLMWRLIHQTDWPVPVQMP